MRQPIVLHLRTGSVTVDDRGEPGAPTVVDRTTRGAVQQVGTNETGVRGGPIVNAEWRLFLPHDEQVDGLDAVTLVRTGQRFELEGEPWQVVDELHGPVSHIEARVERKG